MYEAKVALSFSGAHSLRHYEGKCEELHGHNWKVEVTVTREKLDRLGMVIDFKRLKKKLNSVLDILDHKHLNDLPYFKKVNPTSENIAKFIHDKLNLKSAKVTVWETDNSTASYYKG
jgi:6-pyruvoyltetrahydropterin/6-carboxytetrahydropterin synthase